MDTKLLLALGTACLLSGCEGHEHTVASRGVQTHRHSRIRLVPATGSLVLLDRETGSTFNLRGEAIAGPLAASRRILRQVPGTNMSWSAWSVFHPGSEIWGRTERVRMGRLPEDQTGHEGCGVVDCVPSLPNNGPPHKDLKWTTPGTAEALYLKGTDMVQGVFYNDVARAYPNKILRSYELINDHIGALHFTVTRCRYTRSTMVFDATDRGFTFGMNGGLFNSNAVLYDHQTHSQWPQLLGRAVAGPAKGTVLNQLPSSEMTWARWQELHRDTVVLSGDNGSPHDYPPDGDDVRDPYEDWMDSHLQPPPDPLYPKGSPTLGLLDAATGAARAYVHEDLLTKAGEPAVVNDSFAGRPVVVVYDAAARLVLVFDRRTTEGVLNFDAARYGRKGLRTPPPRPGAPPGPGAWSGSPGPVAARPDTPPR